MSLLNTVCLALFCFRPNVFFAPEAYNLQKKKVLVALFKSTAMANFV